MQTTDPSTLKRRAQTLQLNGLLSNWSACCTEPWVATLLDWEEQENTRRSMERRLHSAHIGRFKPLTDYDWSWPEQIDQGAVSELMTLQFLQTASNAILVGPSGVGKTTIAQNIAHQAVLQGHTVMFTTAGKLLGDTDGYQRPLSVRPRGKRSSGGHDAATAPQLPHLGVTDCVHYTLTLDPDVALLGCSFPNEQDAAWAAARTFTPLPAARMDAVRADAAQAIAGKGSVWWNPPA